MDYKEACQTLVQLWNNTDGVMDPLTQDTVAALNNLVASVQAQLELDARPSKLQQALNGDPKAAREILIEMNVIDEHGNLTPYYSQSC